MHQQLAEVTASLEECKKTKEETPQEEQERLLQQVKADNQEMGSMEKRYGLLFILRIVSYTSTFDCYVVDVVATYIYNLGVVNYMIN